jgi:hypothetical protein
MAREVQPDAPTFYASQVIMIRFAQGRLGEVEKGFRVLVEDPDFDVRAAEAFLALIYSETDRPEEARRFYEPLAAGGFSAVPFDPLWASTLAACAEVCARLGDTPSAEVLHRLFLPYSDHVAGMITGGMNIISHYLGVLDTVAGRGDEAESWFAATVARQDGLGTPVWMAHTRLEWARMLRSRRRAGDAERARELLGLALAAARELGLGRIEQQAVGLLSELGDHPAGRPAPNSEM